MLKKKKKCTNVLNDDIIYLYFTNIIGITTNPILYAQYDNNNNMYRGIIYYVGDVINYYFQGSALCIFVRKVGNYNKYDSVQIWFFVSGQED